MDSAKRQRVGFTLIELLVVVSIIALLVSILLPALGRAREAAKQSVCLSNCSQMGKAVHMYAHDYDGFVPQVYGVRGWTTCLPKYMGSKLGDWQYFQDVWRCPSADPKTVLHHSYGASSAKNQSTAVAFVFSPDAVPGGWVDKHQRLDAIRPSSLLIADSLDMIDLLNPAAAPSLRFAVDTSGDGVSDAGLHWQAFVGGIDLRHGNKSSTLSRKANVVLAMGSARPVDYEELTENEGDNELWRNIE